MCRLPRSFLLFFFNDTATTEIYTLSLHDALPIFRPASRAGRPALAVSETPAARAGRRRDRKSTRLNSSHANISYAVFCLKKKKKTIRQITPRYHTARVTSLDTWTHH